ncbi:MAG: hypothetical protein O7B26_00820, partial [Planctomycetota bacterium]|nr:hypothetical protein [Planctomycetota bacterium]
WPRKSESVAPHSGYSYSIEYEHVEFDRPDHPRKIGPDLFGLPVGIGVYAPEFNGRYLGDGEMVSEAAWGGIRDRYDPAPLRAFWTRNMASNRGTVPTWWGDERFALEGLAYTPDLWEVYVRRWILKYKYSQFYNIAHPHPLSEQQINAALAILKDCRKKARPILESVSKELSAINKALGSSSSPAPGESVEELEPKDTEANRRKANLLARRKAKLEEPNPGIVRLFAELKQRLDDLLRLEQRAYAVNSRPSPVTARVGRKAE